MHQPLTNQMTMKTETKFEVPKHMLKEGPKVKTLEVQLSIASENLREEVGKLFNLAKSTGKELNLCFRA